MHRAKFSLPFLVYRLIVLEKHPIYIYIYNIYIHIYIYIYIYIYICMYV